MTAMASQPPRRAYAFDELLEAQQSSGQSYLEFIRRDSMSVGVYVLPAGGRDAQGPHTEDEVYVVLLGEAMLNIAGVPNPVGPGSVVFVEANVEHHFEAIESDLKVLVFFAPAEGSAGQRG
jgi:mannose-6-phosphate isomerase-like protein (cupin superfamily)